MLRFFRLNDPYRLLFVLLAVIVLGVIDENLNDALTIPEFKGILVGEMMADGKSLYTEVWTSTPPLTGFIQYLHDLVFDRSQIARHIVAMVLIFFQCAFLGILLINKKAFNESNYLPSFLMAVVFFFSFDTLNITGEIIASTFLLLAINNLLIEIEFKQQRDETIHNLGLFLGLATLSVFTYYVFFIATIFLLFVFTRIEIRRFLLFIIGFLLPHLGLAVWHFWNNSIDLLWSNFYMANFVTASQNLISLNSLLFLTGLPLIYFILSLIMMRRDGHLTKYQSQIAQVMLLWFVIALIEVFLNKQRTPQSLLVFIPPFAYYTSHYFLLIRRKWIAELMIWIFVIGVISIGILSSKSIIKTVDYSNLVLAKSSEKQIDKRVLVLSEDITSYRNNITSTYFLEWGLFQKLFNEPDVYQHISIVAAAFESDPPEIIIDPDEKFKSILKYIPSIRQQYRKDGIYYFRINQ